MAGASALALRRLPSRSEPHPQKRCNDDCVLFSVWVFICYAAVDDQYMGSELQRAHLCFFTGCRVYVDAGLGKGWLHSLVLSSSPPPTPYQHAAVSQSQHRRGTFRRTDISVLCNVISHVQPYTSSHFCCFLVVRNTSQVSHTPKGKGSHSSMKPGPGYPGDNRPGAWQSVANRNTNDLGMMLQICKAEPSFSNHWWLPCTQASEPPANMLPCPLPHSPRSLFLAVDFHLFSKVSTQIPAFRV